MIFRFDWIKRAFFLLIRPAYALVLLFFTIGTLQAQIPQAPQIPAFLPRADQVPVTQSMPLDGTWIINTIGKKIRIEGGRAFAIDGWLHLFVLDIQPGMVVIKNIIPTGPGQYSAEDLPLMGKWTADVQADRSIKVTVAGAIGPVSYKLTPTQIDNQQWYDQEMQSAGLKAPSANPGNQPSYQFTPAAGSEPPVTRPPAYIPPETAEPVSNSPDETVECEEKEYDPVTDTIRCYKGGEEE